MTRLGVVLSGRGSNFLALADQVRAGSLTAEIAVVISNRPEAPGLTAARERGLTAVSLPSRGLDRETYDRQLIEALRTHNADWVILAGYMRILSAAFVRAFPSRILNIHPSLLPAFPGLDAQHQAFDYGVKIAGCTVHFVDEHLDHGPIVMQAAVPVDPLDTADSLSGKILLEEHRIYGAAIQRLITTPWEIQERRVVFTRSTL
ncbi:MAG: phosphoribosylglycinamide formyltransferase [Acidobacteria bacterium]|nr:phosphoribosylglycinamide formyltransferase [Acidobacteriota bacterium]